MSLRKLFPVKVSDILNGSNDLRVPRIVGCIEKAIETFDGSYLVDLKDETGTIQCVVSGDVTEEYPNITASGSVAVLEKVSVIVFRFEGSNQPARSLNITKRNCIAVFSSFDKKKNSEEFNAVNSLSHSQFP